jgi:hypothetical protein
VSIVNERIGEEMRKWNILLFVICVLGLIAFGILSYGAANKPFEVEVTTYWQAYKAYMKAFGWFYIPIFGFAVSGLILSDKIWR